MNNIKCFIISIIFLTSPWNHTLSQEAEDSTYSYKLDSILVTASRYSVTLKSTPLSVDVISNQSLRSINNILTMKDALIRIPGVIVNNRFNQAQGDKITIRGIGTRSQFGARGIKILLDGIPLTLPDGQTSLNNLNIASVKRIEIIRGPSSALYGNASGGVIFFDSKPERPDNFYITPGLTAGSFHFIKGSIDLGGTLLGGSYSANAYTAAADGFRDHSNSSFSGFNLTTDHDLSEKLNLTTVNNLYYSPFLLNPSSLSKEDSKNNPTKVRNFIKSQGAGKRVFQFQTGVKLDYKTGSKSNFTTTLYGAARSLFNSVPGRIIELDRLTGGIRTEQKTYVDLFGVEAQFIGGIDFEHQSDKRIEFINQGISSEGSIEPENILDNIVYGHKILEQDEKVTGFGVFSILEFPIKENLAISLGARYDNFFFRADDKCWGDGSDDAGEGIMDEISPIIGFTYSVAPVLTLYGNYSTAFQTPTTNELGNKYDGTGGFNQNLQPENMINFEAGVRGFINSYNIYYNAAIYKLFIKNMLIPYQIEDELSEEVYYRNAGESKNTGIELSLQWQPELSYFLAVSYSYMNFKYEEFVVEETINEIPAEINLAGNYVPGIPKNILNVVSGYNPLPNLYTEVRFNWTDSYYANDFNGAKPGVTGNDNDYLNDKYMTFGLSLIYSLPITSYKLNLKLGIENLFDERYNGSIVPNASGNNFYEPASGRAMYITLNAVF